METGEVQLAPAAEMPSASVLGRVTAPGRYGTRRAGGRVEGQIWSRRRQVLVPVFGSLILVAGIVTGVKGHARLQQTNVSTIAVYARLQRTFTELSTIRAHLATATSQSAAAGTTLAAASDQLTTIQTQLASAQTGVRLDGVSISELDTCLSGVDRTLNEISLGDQAGAATSLREVSAACQAAEPSG
jgi:hypothetical protein